MNPIIYTIGYSGFSIKDFMDTLKQRGIQLIVDVRSSPYSLRYTDFNKEKLQVRLSQSNVYYRNYAEEFGARQKDRALYTREGYLDFSLHYKTMGFQNGVNKLIKTIEKGYIFALMCAEKDPINCHRAIMVSRYFSKLGYMVTHIEPNGVEETQEDLDFRLLEKFFPDRNQLSLFAESFKPVDHDALVEEAYKMQNAVIGYRLEDDET